ncbi:MAG: Uma2 family endonuclease [Deltaproteobacteria bacterium]|nr:Uma2 family endonuclease [Deltaproteobacteria bacterium]
MVRASKTSDADVPLPPSTRSYGVSERLVMPDTRFEIIDGEVLYVNAAGPVHGSFHSKLSALLEACAAEGYDVACDMLTRTSAFSDFAPDASVFPEGIDPETEDRALEELAFEIMSSETAARAARKARGLTGRGVRRVFAIDVNEKRVLEWSRDDDGWFAFASSEEIVDRILAAPLRIADLLDAARADDAMARALLLKRNPVLLEAIDAARADGLSTGLATGLATGSRALVSILKSRGLKVNRAQLARIEAERDPETFDQWIAKSFTCASTEELLGVARPGKSTRKRRVK